MVRLSFSTLLLYISRAEYTYTVLYTLNM
jgi:hypothetical protein